MYLLPALIQILAVGPFPPPDAMPVLAPVWERRFDRGVEWCAPVGDGSDAALLVCLKDARIDLFDAASGKSRLTEPAAVQPGVRFAGESGGVAFLYGSSSIQAIRAANDVAGSAAESPLLWRRPETPPPPSDDDPEYMKRILAARATSNGVFVVMNDGRCAVLSAADGAERRRYELPNLALCQLHTHGNTAALWWKRGEDCAAALFDLSAKGAPPSIVDIAETPPIWTGLISSGRDEDGRVLAPGALIMIWPDRFAIVEEGGAVRTRRTPERALVSARTVCLASSRREQTERTGARLGAATPLLVFATRAGGPWAYDLRADEPAYGEPAATRRAVRDPPPTSVKAVGAFLIEQGQAYVDVSVAKSGERVASITAEAAVIDAGIHDGAAYVLLQEQEHYLLHKLVLREGQATTTGEWFRLKTAEESRASARAAVRPTDSPKITQCDSIAGDLRRTIYLGDKLVIVEDDRIRAYTLP